MNVLKTAISIALFYLFMALFNGVDMQQSASLTEFGWWRDTLCRLNTPINFVSQQSRCHYLRLYVRQYAGNWLNNHSN